MVFLSLKNSNEKRSNVINTGSHQILLSSFSFEGFLCCANATVCTLVVSNLVNRTLFPVQVKLMNSTKTNKSNSNEQFAVEISSRDGETKLKKLRKVNLMHENVIET